MAYRSDVGTTDKRLIKGSAGSKMKELKTQCLDEMMNETFNTVSEASFYTFLFRKSREDAGRLDED